MTNSAVERAIAGTDQLVARWSNRHTTAGLAVGVVRDGELAWARTDGLADVTRAEPVTPDTVFRIGSISKTVTAVGLLQLVEQGRLALDDPVEEHLRAWRLVYGDPQAPAVTVRQLLTHTAGIGEVRGLGDLVRPMIGLGVRQAAEQPTLAEYYGAELRVEVPPGSKWAYANHGYATIGQLVEDVSGQPFADYMRTQVLDRLGMHGSDYLRSERVRGRLASGYGVTRRGLRKVTDLEVAVGPAGSMFSSLTDMALYAAALLGGGANQHGRVLREATLASMFAPHWQPDTRLPGMGLAFFLDDIGGHRVAGHDGGWPGFISSLLVAPDDGVAVIAFTNGGRQEVGPLAGQLMRHLLGAPAEVRDDLPDRPEVWPALRGYYAPTRGVGTNARIWMALGGGAEVFVNGDRHLALRALSPTRSLRRGVRLFPDDPDDPLLYRALVPELGPLRVAFGRAPDGRVGALHFGSNFLGTLHKQPALRNPRPWLLAGAAAGIALLVRRR
jgi:CubicO group peptidase (beta-lactamase class C family)